MTVNERILGIMQMLDQSKRASVAGKPFSVDQRYFDPYPDYDAILEKLVEELKAIKIIAYPKISDTDFGINVGFIPDEILKRQISYQIEATSEFDNTLSIFANEKQLKELQATVIMPASDVIILLSDGRQFKLKTLKTDLAPYNFMKYVISNPSVIIRKSTIQSKVLDCENREDMTELVRQSGFDKQLKSYFFKGTTNSKVEFRPQAAIPYQIVQDRITP